MTMDEAHVESGYVQSDGYGQYNDSDINASRLAFSVTFFALIPSHICINLLVITAIYVFKSMQTIQNIIMASASLIGLLAGLAFNPTYALVWCPQEYIHFDRSNKYVCISSLVPALFCVMGAVLNMVMISADRFFAIVYPIKYIKFMTVRRVKGIVISVWYFCAFFALLPYAWNDYERGHCQFYTTLAKLHVRTLGGYITLCVVLSTVFNGVVFYKMCARKMSGKTHQFLKNNTFAIALQLSYVIMWAPYLVSFNLYDDESKTKTVVIFHTIAAILTNVYYSSSTLVYILLRKQARVAIKYILTTPPWKWSEQNCGALMEEWKTTKTHSLATTPSNTLTWRLSHTSRSSSSARIDIIQPKEQRVPASLISDIPKGKPRSIPNVITQLFLSCTISSIALDSSPIDTMRLKPTIIRQVESTVDASDSYSCLADNRSIKHMASDQSINSKSDYNKASYLSLLIKDETPKDKLVVTYHKTLIPE